MQNFSIAPAFNSTRCIRNVKRCAQEVLRTLSLAFNSTRCIRNFWSYSFFLPFLFFLSTPHGALGTQVTFYLYSDMVFKAFNSTRCIRNFKDVKAFKSYMGSFNSTRCIRNPHRTVYMRGQKVSFNSTRCIRNLTYLDTQYEMIILFFQLHTVH